MFENASLLTGIFGRWPSFLNAELLSVNLNRRGAFGPTVDICIYVCEWAQDVVAPGCWVPRKHTDVVMHFTGVEFQGMGWTNSPDVIDGSMVSEIDSRGHEDRQWLIDDFVVSEIDAAEHQGRSWLIQIVPSHGPGATFECVGAMVLSVQPHLNNAE